MMNTSDAARYLGCSVAFLKKLRGQGEGPAYHKFGKAVRYREDDLMAWAEAHRVECRNE